MKPASALLAVTTSCDIFRRMAELEQEDNEVAGQMEPLLELH